MTARIPQDVREQQINALDGLRFVRWVSSYSGSNTKTEILCDCGHSWVASPAKLLLAGTRCPECAKRKMSERFRADGNDVSSRISGLPNITFLRWVDADGYRNMHSKCLVLCDKGHEWGAEVGSLLLTGRGCNKCARARISAASRANPSDVVSQIESFGKLRFVRWLGGEYRSNHSRAVVQCVKCGREWDAYVNNLQKGRACATCSENGYRPGRPGTLYALRSECGRYLKVGITNSFKTRISQLRRATPFAFDVVESLRHEDGSVIRGYEKMFHGVFRPAGITGFDGCTEWLEFDQGILDIMRALA